MISRAGGIDSSDGTSRLVVVLELNGAELVSHLEQSLEHENKQKKRERERRY